MRTVWHYAPKVGKPHPSENSYGMAYGPIEPPNTILPPTFDHKVDAFEAIQKLLPPLENFMKYNSNSRYW